MATKYGTACIGRRVAENALHAIRYAGLTGRPINAHITISFIALGIHDDEAGAVFRKLQISLARWWRYQRWDKGRDIGPTVGIYAHANPAGSRHVHWLMHLPHDLSDDFIAAVNKRLCKLAGLDDIGDALHVQAVARPGGVAKYVLRGIDPAYAEYLHIRAANEGTVSCRRTGTTRSIGKAARKLAGWNRKKNTIDAPAAA
ncbi:MAG: hypothetical protein ACK4SZ_15555 [Allosphingosinicella sp.]|uniref:hypothetical protein n=1 Tax=Allosphingosinicella sp. TaxID=2823234 RepID=UPI003930A52D